MALYQPSNITPSSFAGIGADVIDVNDNVSISWQVNGTSAMNAFDIYVYKNNTTSDYVCAFSVSLSDPFYGTDERGNPVFYVYEPGVTWASKSNQLVNGGSYKLKITQHWTENATSHSVVQNSESVFITRSAPSLSVTPISGTLNSVAQTFTGAYSQAEGDAVTWVRWVLTDSAGTVLDDTGTVYTGVLSYTYDGFFDGETYTLTCTIQTASGASVTVTNNYAVSYDMAEQTGGISLSCNPDDSVTLSWAVGADIPGTPSAEDYGTISGGVLHLAAERSILWNKVNGEPMAFSSPYCFAWRGRIAENETDSETVNSGTWTLDKTYTRTGTAGQTVTLGPDNWGRNPSASDTANTVRTASVSVTTQRTQDESITVSGPMNEIDTVNSRVNYYETIERPYAITNVQLTGQQNFVGWYYWYPDGDANRITICLFGNLDDWKETATGNFTITQMYYTGMAIFNVPESGVSAPVVLSYTAATADVSVYSTSSFAVAAVANSSGTYSVTFSYDYRTTPNNLYRGRFGVPLNANGTLVSASVTSTTATGGTSVAVNRDLDGSVRQNFVSVTVYNANNTDTVATEVTMTYTYQTTGADSYKTVVTGNKPGAVSASIVSTTATRATVTMNSSGNYTVTMYYSSQTSRSAVVSFVTPSVLVLPDLATVSDGTTDAVFSTDGENAVLTIDGTENASIPIPVGAWNMLVLTRTGTMEAVFFDNAGTVIGQDTADFSGIMPTPVSSVQIDGEQECDYVFLSQNPAYNFESVNYQPGWDGNTLFYAAFASDLQAGTITSSESLSVAIYRGDGTTFSPIGIFGSDVSGVRDYGIRSGREYYYEMFYVTGDTFSAGAESETMCRQFRQHTLIEAEEDAELPDVYHPVNVWRFRDNLDAGAYTNQNQPVLLNNFTKYPLWQPSSPAAKSGTLTALIGRFVDGVYTGDTAEDMDKLFALSGSVNPLFYRDMKGNLYMVRLAGPISQTVDNRTGELAVSITVPWVEVGDAENAKIYLTEG